MKNWTRLFFSVALLLIGGCAGPNEYAGTPGIQGQVIGFFLGFWHGVIAPFTLLGSLFLPSVGVYEVHNAGATYNFGFLLGILFWGTSGTRVIYRYTNNPGLEGYEKKI